MDSPANIPVKRTSLHLVLWCLFFLALVLFSFGAADASSVVAVDVSGQVEAESQDGRRRSLKAGDRIKAGEVINAGSGARAVLKLEDGSRIDIFEDTRLEVNELLAGQEKEFSFSLFMGRLSLKLKRIFGRQLVVTPTLAAGVRGTEFAASVADDETSVISVHEGAVSVTTESDEEEGAPVELAAGQEAQVEEAGAAVVPRPVRIRTLKDWQSFRRKRLEKIIPRLPRIARRLEGGVDIMLDRLTKTKTKIQEKAGKIKDLVQKLKALGRRGGQERRVLARQIGRESYALLGLIRRFKVLNTRLKTIFVRSHRFKKIIPRFKERLGPDYKTVDQGLARVLARGSEVRERVRTLGIEAKRAVRPIRPVLIRVKQLQQKKGGFQGSRPVDRQRRRRR